jgi:hypothetical protein
LSVAFDRAAGFYDESRGLRPEVSELVADRVRAEVEAAHPDLDTPQPSRHTFTFTAVRF